MSEIDRRNKWVKYMFFSASEELRDCVPQSEMFSRKTLWEFIAKFDDVILKPANGSRGAGIYRVTARGSNRYRIHHENTRQTISGKDAVYSYLVKQIGSGSYMVQQRISLAKVSSRPFDMRVIVQRRNRSDAWKVTGRVAKVAGRGYIVTNITRSNGTILPLQTAFQLSSLKDQSYQTLQSNIDKIALLSAEKLSKYHLYSSQRIFGFDMAVDRKGKVWIIEVNLRPMLSHFRKLDDRTMYDRIMKYKKSN